MTSSPVDVSPGPNRKRISRPVLSLIAFAGVLIVGALFRWAAERPTRPEFWPFVIGLAIALAVFTYFWPVPYLTYNEKPIEPVGIALLWAIVWGVVEGGVFWVLSYLAWSDSRYWGVALMMGLLAGMNRYAHGRHIKRRHLPQVIAVAAVLALMIAVKLMGRR